MEDSRRMEEFKLNNGENDEYVEKRSVNNYTKMYRIIKTILMTYSWISIGYNNEIYGPVLQDLKILFNASYEMMSYVIIIKFTGYLVWLILIGVLVKKMSHYLNLIVAFTHCLYGFCSFMIPWFGYYWLTVVFHLLEGIAHATFDVCASELVFKLWNGISDSPIIVVYAGYGVGGGIVSMVINKFIKSQKIEKEITCNRTVLYHTSNSSLFVNGTLTPNDIKLQVPYSIGTLFCIVAATSLVIMHFYERKNVKSSDYYEPEINTKHNINGKEPPLDRIIFKKIHYFLFTNTYHRKVFMLSMIQLLVLAIICVSVGSLYITIGVYYFTFSTKGPAKLDSSSTLTIKTIFWFSLCINQMIAARISFKMNKFTYVTLLSLLNIVVFGLHTIPFLNKIKLFHWIMSVPLAMAISPLFSALFLLKNYIFKSANPIVLSLVFIFNIIGTISAQYTVGHFLENFKPSCTWLGYSDATSVYSIPLFFFIYVSVFTISFLFIVLLNFQIKYVKKNISI